MKQLEYYNFIIGRYKHEPVDYFITAASWFTIGCICGLIIAGIIAGL